VDIAKAQGFKRLEVSRIRGSELPGHGQTDMAVAAVVPAAVDAETIRTEVAEINAIAVRGEITAAHIDVLEQPFAGGQKVSDHGIDHFLSGGRVFVLAEQRLLFVPGLASGIGHLVLANQEPTDLAGLLGELLVVVPVLAVEDLALAGDLAPNVDDRQSEIGHQDMGVFVGPQYVFGERNVAQGLELLVSRGEAEALNAFFDTDHVPAHDLTGELLAGGGFVAATRDEDDRFLGQTVARTFNHCLCQLISQAGIFELL